MSQSEHLHGTMQFAENPKCSGGWACVEEHTHIHARTCTHTQATMHAHTNISDLCRNLTGEFSCLKSTKCRSMLTMCQKGFEAGSIVCHTWMPRGNLCTRACCRSFAPENWKSLLRQKSWDISFSQSN